MKKRVNNKNVLITACGGPSSLSFIRSLLDADPDRKKYYIVGTDCNKFNIHRTCVDKAYLWLGANEIHVLKNGLLGVLSHVAMFEENEDRHYYSSVFVFDTESKTYSTIKIIAEREMFEDGPYKCSYLKNVIFSGGITRKENGKAVLYVGTGDTEAQKIEIDDPFIEYEDI